MEGRKIRSLVVLISFIIMCYSLVIPQNAYAKSKITVSKASGTYKVNASALTIRTGNGTNYKKVGSLKRNKEIKVNGKTRNGWYRFKYKGKNRYVHGKYLKKVSSKAKSNAPLVKASGKYKTTANINVRTGNGTKYKKVGRLKKGQVIIVNGKRGNWYQFKYKGKSRYVNGKYLKKHTVKKKNTPLVKASGKYKVTASNLNVRSGNGTSYKKVGSIKKGTVISVNGKRGSWYRFKYKGKNRYVLGKHLKKHTSSSKKKNTPLMKASGKYKVTASALTVRTGNGTNYKKVGTLNKGQVITVNGKRGNWYRFKYKGKNRYVSGKHLKKHTTKKTSSKNVVDKMNKLGNSQQVILVTTKGYGTSKAQIQTYEKNSKGKWVRKLNVSGHVGKNGLTKNKKEGDGKSPVGKFTIGHAFGYKGNPGTKLSFKQSTKNDVWVDDPKSKYYNTWQKNNRKGKDWKSAESMMHRLYTYGFTINYNTERTPYKGSAIFFHVGNSYTVGCTATSQSNVINIMKWVDPKKKPVIIQAPESELKNF